MTAVARSPRLVVALDYPTAAAALTLVARLRPELCRLKVGSELFTRAGPPLVQELNRRGYGVFLDLKFHDIPNTVAAACRAAAALDVWMVNVHLGGGRAMLEAARAALNETAPEHRPLLIGVTVLTSLDAAGLSEVGLACTPAEQTLRLAELGAVTGLDGVVCSAREAAQLRARLGEEFVLVTPGIRFASNRTDKPPTGDDQRRVLTPAAALAAGSDYLVVGRPITRADDPLAALLALSAELQAG